MKVIICGAGQVGWQIARHLSGEKNDVTVVDNNAELVRRATETLDVQGVVGHASWPDVLEKAGARDTDMIIAATHSDEVNMVTCHVAHAIFGITRKIAARTTCPSTWSSAPSARWPRPRCSALQRHPPSTRNPSWAGGRSFSGLCSTTTALS
jgi:predicted dinucleotide-binding enzyme